MQDEITQDLTRELETWLDAAADGLPGAVEGFFRTLLKCEVYAPTHASEEQTALAIIGNTTPADHNFVTIVYDGKECLPIFTREEFLYAWAGNTVPYTRKDFRSLIWRLGKETWMYLNSNQEVGKELTPWEIELLRKGEEAIDELARAQSEEPFDDIEVRAASDLYPELKRALIPILQIYPELQEAFIVAVKEGGSEEEKPLVGIRYSKISEGKRAYLKSELEYLLEQEQHNPCGNFMLIDDLDNEASPNLELFANATPFYFAPKQERETGSRWHQAFAKLRSIFSRKDSEQPARSETKIED
jgi:hypothetical protein